MGIQLSFFFDLSGRTGRKGKWRGRIPQAGGAENTGEFSSQVYPMSLPSLLGKIEHTLGERRSLRGKRACSEKAAHSPS